MKFRFIFLFFFVFLVQRNSTAQAPPGKKPGFKQEQSFSYCILNNNKQINLYGFENVNRNARPDKDGYVKLWDAHIFKGSLAIKRPLKMMARLKYFDGSEELLYRDIKDHKVIENCYINRLDLRKLGTINNGTLRITEPINITSCVVGNICTDYQGVENIVFNMPVCIQNSYIKIFFILSVDFNSNFYWLNNNCGYFRILYTRFNNAVHLTDYCSGEPSGIAEMYTIFYNPKLNGSFNIYNGVTYGSLNIYNCVANDSVVIHANSKQKSFNLKSNSFKGSVVTNPYDNFGLMALFPYGINMLKEQVWNLAFDNSQFNNYADFSHSEFNNCSFKDITFKGPLIIYNTLITNKDTGAADYGYTQRKKRDFSTAVFMKDNLPLICNPDFFNLDTLGFLPTTIAKSRLDFETMGQNGFRPPYLEK
ncbi:hypothetical protein SAMN04488505_102714 [Chitinophaga rupis]|uniref:Pentapeptide repeat-containing protein n=1 Tax=Chitinophaga rupis TaxID=573321 RepID=A0A1H7RSY7_9BACT|nr:pentapeptide repeat-containing protein [Chitinophaga rupis]SEL62894.1 hypothetical protein SAMN04488505_102714 [Chitinophaga rupis]